MANESKSLADLLHKTTADLAPGQLNAFRQELTRTLPDYLKTTAAAVKANTSTKHPGGRPRGKQSG